MRWPSQIIASHHTLSGVTPRSASRFSMRERLEAARAAGYDGIGLAYYDFAAQLERGETLGSLRQAVEDTGVPVVELEILYGWNADSERTAAREAEAWLHQMAELFGARHMNVAVSQPPESHLDARDVARRFGALCDRAAQVDLIVGLEFQPLNAVSNLRIAWDIVRAAERDNGGILLDSWHFFRSRSDLSLLETIPPEAITGVQISDAAADPWGSLWEDTTRRRLLPGSGAFPLGEFVGTLQSIGVECPLAVEMISEEHMGLAVDEAARQSYDATIAVLDR